MDVPLPPSVTTHDTHAPGAPHAAAAPAAATGAGGFFANLLSNITGEPSHASGAAAGAGAAPAAGRAGFARVSDPDAATNAHANATARGGVGTVQRGGVDPAVLEGLSVEDRIAVESAMQEMALEMESAQEAGEKARVLHMCALPFSLDTSLHEVACILCNRLRVPYASCASFPCMRLHSRARCPAY